ncbi:hypothetical protein TD95_003311 [Thielaviopsis punctulata]|uniref:Branchpoint-bridging protein n=1 Tax=Thielaviopsis punctulata TaxID=72032 RepID=A0A0F4ZE81_9PEZI|nr:hypothetical protein TD95_003311 [Thielaviopsis punctulata]
MSWRNQGITGSNNIPLGKARRRFGDDASESSSTAGGDSLAEMKRGRSPEPRNEGDGDGTRRRKKRNRWGDASDNKAAGLMGLPTAITANMTSEQLEAYTLYLRIEEIGQKLKIDDVVPADGDRSPSPPPQYDSHGRRINTREYRYRKRLEDERHKLIEKAMKTIPNYHPPQDYRRPTKTQDKVYVPVNDYPGINFSMITNPPAFPTNDKPDALAFLFLLPLSAFSRQLGLLIGPRGNTLKKMETESGAKIAIRGKGSVKEGKGRSDAAHSSNQEEDLHCLIMADTEEKVEKAKKLIYNVIETAASIPEGQNELKRNQLRELATLNGTLRDDENQACQNCGMIGHRKYDCPDKPNFTANIICNICRNAGHMARDCPDRQRGSNWRDGPRGARAAITQGDAVDREYEQLMQELGGGPSSGAPAMIEAGSSSYQNGGDDRGGESSKPWQRQATGGPAPWRSRRDEPNNDSGNGGSSGSAPWARDRRRDDYSNGDRGDRDRGDRGDRDRGGDRGGDRHRDSRDRGERGDRSDYYGGQGYGSSLPPPPPSVPAPLAPGANAAAPPWNQAVGTAAVPGYGTSSFGATGYGNYGVYGAYSAVPPGVATRAPPGGAPPGMAGLNDLISQYSSNTAVPPPPPPPSSSAPPPPPDSRPPPPPPPGA